MRMDYFKNIYLRNLKTEIYYQKQGYKAVFTPIFEGQFSMLNSRFTSCFFTTFLVKKFNPLLKMTYTKLIKNMFESFTFLYLKIKRTYYIVIMVNEKQIEIVTSICQIQGMFLYGLHPFKMYLVNEVVFYPTKENKLFHEFEIILLLFILGKLVGVTNKLNIL